MARYTNMKTPPIVYTESPLAESRATCDFARMREQLHSFKYEANYGLVVKLGARLLREFQCSGWQPTMIVPVPMHAEKQKSRGFNHAALLAQVLSALCGVPYAQPLERIRSTVSQTKLGRHERAANMAGAFAFRQQQVSKDLAIMMTAVDVSQSRIVLVDDVITTGSTLMECARVLRSRNAAIVWALTVARTAAPLRNEDRGHDSSFVTATQNNFYQGMAEPITEQGRYIARRLAQLRSAR